MATACRARPGSAAAILTAVEHRCLQDWKDASQALTSIAFNRSYPIRDEPGASILKQNIGSFTLRNRASVHIRSFGIFNLQLWDDVMAEFAPITTK